MKRRKAFEAGFGGSVARILGYPSKSIKCGGAGLEGARTLRPDSQAKIMVKKITAQTARAVVKPRPDLYDWEGITDRDAALIAASVHVAALPRVAVENRRRIPRLIASAVYLLLDDLGNVAYVGETSQLRSRISMHPKLINRPGWSIAWFEVREIEGDRHAIESALCIRFKPRLNSSRMYKPAKYKLREWHRERFGDPIY